MSKDSNIDLAVVGLGTAGAAAAAFAAQHGMNVVGFDAKPLNQAGARWVNGVPAWTFDEAKLARPEPPELRGAIGQMLLVAGWGPTPRVTVDGRGVLDVDMRHLVQRLQDIARDSGARLFGETAVHDVRDGVLWADGREIRPRFVVDASGLDGIGCVGNAKTKPEDLCVASQQVHRLIGRKQGEAFLAQHGAEPEQSVFFSGVAGGYSVFSIRLEGDEVSLLGGSIPALGHQSGADLVRRFVKDHDWIGERLFGGARPIPLNRPHTRLAQGRVALLGDAGAQVYATHGSGIGAGIVAARLLADTLAAGGDPEDYSLAWQRRWGGLFCGSEMFARFSREMTVDDIASMMRAGWLDSSLATDLLAQKKPAVDPKELGQLLLGVVREPKQAKLVPLLLRMLTVRGLYRAFPTHRKLERGWKAGLRLVT